MFVEVPYGHGWIGAVEVIEAASLLGKIRTGGLEPDAFPTADQLAQQLSVLIEADLPFKATAGLHRAWPNRVTDERGADPAPARLRHRADGHRGVDRRRRHRRAPSTCCGWTTPGGSSPRCRAGTMPAAARVRRRFRSFGCCGVTEPVDDLVALGLLAAPQEAR